MYIIHLTENLLCVMFTSKSKSNPNILYIVCKMSGIMSRSKCVRQDSIYHHDAHFSEMFPAGFPLDVVKQYCTYYDLFIAWACAMIHIVIPRRSTRVNNHIRLVSRQQHCQWQGRTWCRHRFREENFLFY